MLDGFCEYLRQQGKSENTVKAYSQGMKDYMRWYEETFGKRMKVLLRPNVLDYISYLRTVKGLSNRSVNAKLASLHSFNLYLISAGYKTEMVLTMLRARRWKNIFIVKDCLSLTAIRSAHLPAWVMKVGWNPARWGGSASVITTRMTCPGIRWSSSLLLLCRRTPCCYPWIAIFNMVSSKMGLGGQKCTPSHLHYLGGLNGEQQKNCRSAEEGHQGYPW